MLREDWLRHGVDAVASVEAEITEGLAHHHNTTAPTIATKTPA